MAFTRITDIVNPEVLGDQIAAKFPDHLVLGNTNLVSINAEFPLGSPGTVFKMPFWKRIGAFAPFVEGTAITPSNITTGAENATVIRAALALEVNDTASLVSVSDPVAEISNQIARRAAEYIDAKLVLQLGLTPNTLDYTGLGTGGKMDQNAIIQGMLTLGDNMADLQNGGAIIMHSKVYADLLQTGAIQNNYQSGLDVLKTGRIGTLLGLPIISSDLVTTSVVSSVTKYQSFIVGPGALALFYQRQVMVEFDRDILLKADVISSDVHFAAHLFGYDDTTTAVVAQDNKSIHVVNIKSN